MTFPADYKNIAPFRDLGYHVAKLQGFSEQQAEYCRAVIDELCNNAIEYGSQKTSEVMLEIYADEQAIRITCHDQGHGNKLRAEEITRLLDQPVANDAPRGRGIRMIVKGFADEFHLSDRSGGGISAVAVMKKK